jgi:hypothetical protein
MAKIPSIILSYDLNRSLTNHVIKTYDHLWSSHPFHFHIPYQNFLEPYHQNSIYIQTKPEIKPTVLTLLQGFADDDWIYWCIDDKYPIQLDINSIKLVSDWILSGANPDVSGILLCRTRKLLNPENLTGHSITIGNQVFLERKGYHQIWIHQFLRVKVIRSMFKRFPDHIPEAKLMDEYKDKLTKDPSHRIYVSEENRAIFGESTIGKKITPNCQQSMRDKGVVIPEWFVETTSTTCIMGDDNFKSTLQPTLKSRVD